MRTHLNNGLAAVIAFLLVTLTFTILSLAGQAGVAPVAPVAGSPAQHGAPAVLYDVGIMAGATTNYTDTQGRLWYADRQYTTGGFGWTVPGVLGAADSSRPIIGTNDPTLYRNSRNWNAQTGNYRFDVPNGTYSVELRFAELFLDRRSNFRLFDVEINGVKYLCNMDIISANNIPGSTDLDKQGNYIAYDWTFVVTVTNSVININFIPRSAIINQAFVNAIRVTQLEDYSPPPSPPYPRLGVGLNYVYGSITDYDIAALHVGWYSNWSIMENPPRPNGVEYVQLIHTRDFSANTYDWNLLGRVIDNNPGSTFIIGNEIEATFQGAHTPQAYADIYHSLAQFIKGRDPTAKLAVGGVIMVSEARLRWLEAALQAYQNTYGTPMPIDIWTIHEQILNGDESQSNNWPVGLPLAAAAPEWHSWVCAYKGAIVQRGPVDVAQFQNDIIRFRQWMNQYGYRNTPLWISEYGVLGGEQYNCTQRVIGEYLQQTMEWMNNAAFDSSIGMPGDENRLVQRWLWYSLNDQPYYPPQYNGFSGAMCWHECNQYPGALTGVGRLYRTWVNSITPPGPTPTPTQTRTPTVTPTPTFTRTPLPPGNGILQGRVQLQGRGAAPTPAWQVPVTVSMFLPGDNLPAYQFAATTDDSGNFNVPGTATPGIWPGSVYNVKLKNPQMLQSSVNDLAFSNSTPTAQDFGLLKTGDVNNDNRISLADLSILSSVYGRDSTSSGYDGRADLNGDTRISLADLSLLSSNYGQTGLAEVRQGAGTHAGLQAAPSTSIIAVPNRIWTNVGNSFDVDIQINVNSGPADSAEFHAYYDQSFLSVLSVRCSGSQFSAQQCSAGSGAISYVGSILGGSVGNGQYFLMHLQFRALATTNNTSLTFGGGPNESCYAGDCAASSTSGCNINITNPPTRTPTPTLCPGCPTHTPTPTPPPLDVRINAGGPAYRDTGGQLWLADQEYQPGGWGYVGASQTYSTTNGIDGTDDDPLYQTERYYVSEYRFDALPGTYSVTLKFAEIYYATNPGQRVFSVNAEGQTVISGLDVVAQAGGRYKALDRSFTVNVTDYQLNLEFIASAGPAALNALHVKYMGGGPPTATPTATSTAIAGATATATATALPSATPTATATPRDPYEPNNSFDQATAMEPNRDYRGYIDSPSDGDYFAFSVNEANSYIWASLTDLPADYDLFLYGPDHSLVDWSNHGGTMSEYILNYFVGNQTGVYYLLVVGYNRAFDGVNPYRLRMEIRQATPTATPTLTMTATPTPTFTPTGTRTPTATATRLPLDPYEPNNSFDQATAIVAGNAYTAYLDNISDTDYYKFTVPAAGRMIMASLTMLPADYDLYLADPSRNVVAWSRYGGTASEYLFFTAPSAGTYYLIVVGYNHAYDPTNSYRLAVQLN